MGRVSRRDAETQRVLFCVAFSPRLCASAGDGFRYCFVAFQFHCGVWGPRSEECEWGGFPAETLRRRDSGWISGKLFAHVEVAV